jgi:2-dehydro-3-deoxyphosphogluconate aldolase / (4S)-4-hydroxy-2-oxoglutarate aldolase
MPLFYEPNIEKAKEIMTACYKGGVRIMELTNRGDFAHEVFGELIKFSAKELPEMVLGIGTIIDGSTAALYMQLGANFIVTPMFHEDIARTCNRRKIPWMCGCATLTEISRCEEMGAEMVKLFPGEILSPAFVKGAKGPMPWSSFLITGGVEPTHESLKAWFDAGATGVGMGSKLIYKGGSMTELEEKSRFCIDTIKTLKSK